MLITTFIILTQMPAQLQEGFSYLLWEISSMLGSHCYHLSFVHTHSKWNQPVSGYQLMYHQSLYLKNGNVYIINIHFSEANMSANTSVPSSVLFCAII